MRAELTMEWAGRKLPFAVERTETRRFSVAVNPDGTVEVRAPIDATDQDVIERVRRRGSWIARQLEHFSQWRPRTPVRQYIGGETHWFQGRQLRLRVIPSTVEGIMIAGDRLVVSVPRVEDRDRVKNVVALWYAHQAKRLLRDRVEAQRGLWRRHRVAAPSRVLVRPLVSRWGSMTARGTLILNSDLVRASVRLADYVIAHEWAHLAHPDHGAAWSRLLDVVMPDWRQRKSELEKQML